MSSAVLPTWKSAGAEDTDRASEEARSMPNLATTPESSTDLPSDATLLGVDGEGYDHYLSPYRQTVYILDSDDQIDREVDVHGRSLTTYGQWVSQTRGRWAEWYCLENCMADLIDQLVAEVTPDAQPGD